MTEQHGHAGVGGLQKFSVGEAYPWSVLVTGEYVVGVNLLDRRECPRHPYVDGQEGSLRAALVEADLDIHVAKWAFDICGAAWWAGTDVHSEWSDLRYAYRQANPS